ncbi:MAG: redoxin domain-containing protein [Dehalococcoidia bacterium]
MCQAQLVELQGAYGDLRAEGAELLAVSTDGLADAERMVSHANAQFPVLADSDHAVASSYGLFDLLGDGVSAPATLILGPNGAIIGGRVGEDINDRVPAAAILQFLQEYDGA